MFSLLIRIRGFQKMTVEGAVHVIESVGAMFAQIKSRSFLALEFHDEEDSVYIRAKKGAFWIMADPYNPRSFALVRRTENGQRQYLTRKKDWRDWPASKDASGVESLPDDHFDPFDQ